MSKVDLDRPGVVFKGKALTLVQDAYADNFQGRVCYFAIARDIDDDRYKVRWETSDLWDEADKRVRTNNDPYGAYLAIIEDEYNACDWDNPVDIELI